MLHRTYGRWPPCQPTARLPHRAARHRLGYEATCTVQGARKLTGFLHTSSHGQAPLGPCPPRADKRRRSSSAAKPYLITDDGPSAASTTTHHPKLLLVGINAPSCCQDISPPTTCLTTFYILGNGNSRARHSTDRPKRRHLAQKFPVIFHLQPLHPTAIPQVSFLVHLLLIDTPCLQNVPCLVLCVL